MEKESFVKFIYPDEVESDDIQVSKWEIKQNEIPEGVIGYYFFSHEIGRKVTFSGTTYIGKLYTYDEVKALQNNSEEEFNEHRNIFKQMKTSGFSRAVFIPLTGEWLFLTDEDSVVEPLH